MWQDALPVLLGSHMTGEPAEVANSFRSMRHGLQRPEADFSGQGCRRDSSPATGPCLLFHHPVSAPFEPAHQVMGHRNMAGPPVSLEGTPRRSQSWTVIPLNNIQSLAHLPLIYLA